MDNPLQYEKQRNKNEKFHVAILILVDNPLQSEIVEILNRYEEGRNPYFSG